MRILILSGLMILASTAYAGGGYGGQQQIINGDFEVKPNNSSRSESSSTASADSSASGGAVTIGAGGLQTRSEAAGGNATSNGGSSNSSTEINYSRVESASSAASVYAGYCQTGGSGQVASGGFSVINGDQFCEHIRMADRALLAYQQMVEWCRNPDNVACDTSKQAEYLAMYHENIADADSLVQTTQATSWIGRVLGQLAPLGIMALLLL